MEKKKSQTIKKAQNMNRCWIHIFNTIGLLILYNFSLAQPSNSANCILLNEHNQRIDNFFIQHPSQKFHSSFRPYSFLTLTEIADTNNKSGFPINYNTGLHKQFSNRNDPSKYNALTIIPILDVQAGYDGLRQKILTETSGGIYLRYDLREQLSSCLTVMGGEVSYPEFTDTLATGLNILPGQGIAYGHNNRYQWSNLSGYVSYTPNGLFNFQLGKDKHFIGDGYRSLLLSDAANNYPYFRSSVNIWNIQYACWYSWMYDISQSNGNRNQFLNKFGTFHYLSWNITKKTNISLFENIIWQGTDSNRVRNMDVNYFNPVIFFRPVEYSLGSSDNAFIGINFSWKIARTLKFYAQVAADEFYLKEIKSRQGWWANKQGIQAGIKYINAFTVKNLLLQGEFNIVRPYTYSHGSAQQSYSHFNQPLAHPLGANFYEGIGMLSYAHHRLNIQVKAMYAIIGKDTAFSKVSMGQNVQLSYLNRPTLANGNPQDYNHYIGQGVRTEIIQLDGKISYYVIPKINLRLECGLILTQLKNAMGYNKNYPYLYLGLRSSLHNFYRDIF